MTGSSLSPDEIQTARLMRREGKTIAWIARKLKRSRAAIGDACRGAAHINDVHVVAVPAHVLAERDARLALDPRNLTAAFAGDPLPGRSALDKKMAGVTAMRASLHCVRSST
jgi:DNA-binding CsgD family transcriptional regulator